MYIIIGLMRTIALTYGQKKGGQLWGWSPFFCSVDRLVLRVAWRVRGIPRHYRVRVAPPTITTLDADLTAATIGHDLLRHRLCICLPLINAAWPFGVRAGLSMAALGGDSCRGGGGGRKSFNLFRAEGQAGH